MLGDPDWEQQLRKLRLREFRRIFGECPDGSFRRVLELGAGNGYQSGLLAEIADQVVATDYAYREKLPPSREGVDFRYVDAERVAETFQPATFDLVFSSNLLEHLPNPEAAIAGSRRLLAPDGVMIHVVPSVWWKLASMGLFYPFQARRLLRKMRQLAGGSSENRLRRTITSPQDDQDTGWVADNNPKIERSSRSRWRDELFPSPHGASPSNSRELLDFRKSRWLRLFRDCDLTVAAVIPGPLSSGRGFGFDRLRRLLEAMGFAGEFAYVAHRPGEEPESLRLIGREGTSADWDGSQAASRKAGPRR